MRRMPVRFLFRPVALVISVWLLAVAGSAEAAERVRVGVLKFGTVSWELDTIKHHGLDSAEGVEVVVVPFAGEAATNVALQAGAVDVIVSDWLWVSRQRSAGHELVFAPFSAAVGALMLPPGSPVESLADLAGRRIGIAGDPLDKNWLFIRGLAQRDHGIDLDRAADPVFGAAPLLAEKALRGELDAVLNFWHYCARLEAQGFNRLIGGNEAAAALSGAGPVSALGYVFRESWAEANEEAAAGFLRASGAAKQILADSDDEWHRLKELTGAADDKTLHVLMARFREGIPERAVAEEERDANRLFAVLAELGGERLVGRGKTLATGTYWQAPEEGP